MNRPHPNDVKALWAYAKRMAQTDYLVERRILSNPYQLSPYQISLLAMGARGERFYVGRGRWNSLKTLIEHGLIIRHEDGGYSATEAGQTAYREAVGHDDPTRF